MIKIKKQKIDWIIEEKRIIAFDSLQATSYSLVNDNLKKDLNSLKQELINSDSGNTWVEVVSLAYKYHLTGVAIKKDERWLDDTNVIFQKRA